MRHIAVAAGVAVIALLPVLPAAGATGCGGLLQPKCPPPYSTSAPDPGGDQDAGLTVPPPAGKLFGFNTNLWRQTANGGDYVPFEVTRSSRAGSQVLRTTVTWASFATGPSQPLGGSPVTLARLDELYQRASAAGMQLDLVMSNAPLWATAYASCTGLAVYTPRCAPVRQGDRLYPTVAHLQDLSNFVTALGERYPGAIFETWNEPNFDQGPQAVSGSFIGQMQCAVWQAAKALTQPSMVLSAAFSPYDSAAATKAYMDAFYATGGACFDRLSVHTYNGITRRFGADSPLAGEMQIYRDARAGAGDTRPMWVTEFGFSSGTRSGEVSEGQQDQLTRWQYNKLLTMPDVEAALVHTLRDDSNATYGWLRSNGSAKPVYCDFTQQAGDPACP